MLSDDAKKELFDRLNDKKKEIAQLKEKLNELNAAKENAFQERDKKRQEIIKLIGHVKLAKSTRDEFTGKVKEDKEVRKQTSDEIKKLIEEVKILNKEKDSVRNKFNLKSNPSEIKREIERMEYKIETDGLSFEKEKELMKLIKQKKKQYDEAKNVSGVWDKIHEVSKRIDELKIKADDAHKNIQSFAHESQKKHEVLIEDSKQIDDLKKQEEEFNSKFLEHKAKFNEVNDELKKRLVELSEINDELAKNNIEVKDVQEKKQRQILKEKELAVEEKIKRKMKLTTEDLLVYQKNNKDSD